jgi:hypothetical protein
MGGMGSNWQAGGQNRKKDYYVTGVMCLTTPKFFKISKLKRFNKNNDCGDFLDG